ncbi:hypothetical protein ACLIA0_07505 [Bacillaceae bacterium W0354]
MKKLLSSLILVTVLLLAACGGESKSDKEVVVNAFESVMEAKSYEAEGTVDLNIDADVNDPFVAPYLQMINDIELSVDTKYDGEKQMQEAVVHFSGTISPMTINLDLPFLQDMKNQKMYIATDSLMDNFGMFLGLPEDIKGKLIELEMAELEAQDAAEVEELTKQAQQIVVDLLNEKSDDEFSKDGDVYTIKFTEEDLVNLFNKLLVELDDTVTAQDLEDVKAELEAGLEEIDFNKFEVQLTIDGDELKQQKFIIDLGFNVEGDQVNVALTLDNTYKSFNKDVEFSINPEDYEIIGMEELEQIIFEQMYGF